MNATLFSALYTLAAAPILEPETYTIQVTPQGKRTARRIKDADCILADLPPVKTETPDNSR